MKKYQVIIVGAGHAGVHCAALLRQQGFSGDIALLSEEEVEPYERPPLSKEYLGGSKSWPQMLQRPSAFWQAQRIDLLTGRRVEVVDPQQKIVVCGSGERLAYQTLVWATGGRARRLSCPGGELRGLHVIRQNGDVDRLAAALADVREAVVIGGGFIGLEAAAVLRKQGKAVTLLESGERLLRRATREPLAAFLLAEHRAHGVDVRLHADVRQVTGVGAMEGLLLADGQRIAAPLAIVGIGIEPAVEPLRAAGLATEGGVEVDALCRTGLPEVYAIGDCVRQQNPWADGARLRGESVQNALDQAALVARRLLGLPPVPPPVPWFWSNQYDLRIQMAGLSSTADRCIVRGEAASRSFSVAYLRDGQLVAMDCVNAGKDFMQAKTAIARGLRPDTARLADPTQGINSL